MQSFYTDGKSIKNIDLPQYPDAAWQFITGAPDAKNKEAEIYSRVSAVYRVANMTADSIANIPFSIVNSQGDAVDTSEDWQNVIGFMDNPRELLRLWRMSLFMTNSAYGFMEGNRVVKNLRYIAPSTITPVAGVDGITGFKRTLGSKSANYSIKDNKIFWMFRLDYDTELLPSANTEMRALMAAGGVLFYSDYYVENFFQRGGIKPSLLFVKGSPLKEDRERIESAWDKITRGFYKYLGKVFNAETMTVQTIGDGIENLTKTQLHDDKISDIALAAGMPLSLLLANSANYSTAETEKQTWLRDTVQPWAMWMQEEINNKLFDGTGLSFQFRFEAKTEMQDEEVKRASAYQTYINAGMLPSVAAQVVGVDLPPNVEYTDLDKMTKPVETKPPETMEDEPDDEEEPEEMKSVPERSLTIDQVRELDLWQQFAFRKNKRHESLDFPFVCKTVPEDVAEKIRRSLPACKSEQDIKNLFDGRGKMPEVKDLTDLVDAINRAANIYMEEK